MTSKPPPPPAPLSSFFDALFRDLDALFGTSLAQTRVAAVRAAAARPAPPPGAAACVVHEHEVRPDGTVIDRTTTTYTMPQVKP